METGFSVRDNIMPADELLSLKGKRIPCFRAPVAGLPMVHWDER